jgi:ketosteroid isomerase-like protein
MRNYRPFLISGVLAFICCGTTHGVPAADKSAVVDDKAAIETLEKDFSAAFNAKDLDKVMSVYAPGKNLFVFDVVPPRQYVGWEAYKKDWKATFDAFPGPIAFSISDLNVTVVGGVAYGHSVQEVHFTKSDGSKVAMTVRATDVYRKMHGRWLIVQEHVSVPVDLDTGKPDLLSKP